MAILSTASLREEVWQKHKYQGTLQYMYKVKCYVDNLVIASKYKLRTMNRICCIQPSLFSPHLPSIAELNRINGRNISNNVEV